MAPEALQMPIFVHFYVQNKVDTVECLSSMLC